MNDMLKNLLCVMTLMMCALGMQAQRVSGTVVDSLGSPVPNVAVAELDKYMRIVNSTKTNSAGKFTMTAKSKDLMHLRITAAGYRMQTLRQVPRQNITITLEAEQPSRLELLEKERNLTKRKYVLTSNLLCGRMAGREVPWLVMVEHLGDSVFVLRLPVKVDTQTGVYTEGRMAVIEGYDQKQTLQWYNGEDAYPVEGLPNERATWVEFCKLETRDFMRQGYIAHDFDDDAYFYPAFIVKRNELQSLVDNPDSFARLLIDNQRANNVWIMYPLRSFSKEMQKILKKFEDVK